MLLKSKEDDGLVEINEVSDLIDPFKEEVMVQMQEGQNEQPPEPVKKSDLVFPSGEALPLCWLDSNYKLKS
jgi:hypothetical protein